MRTSTFIRVAPAVAAAVLAVPAAARAQNAAVTNSSAKLELGADAGANFGLGSNSYTELRLPAERARVGFFLPGDGRLEIEPAIGVDYRTQKNSPSATLYNLEIGALYHFTAPTYATNATGATVAYVRPFLNYRGTIIGDNGGDSHATTLGGGLGLKLPVRQNIALRGEANLGYDFSNKAARLGLLAGASFFTFR